MTETAYIPNELKQCYTWGCFNEQKQLISAISGLVITSRDYESLTTYQDSYDYAIKHPNQIVGLAFVLPENYICIDIQVNKKVVLDDYVSNIVSYCEFSLTGDSIHLFIKANFNETKKLSIENGIKLLTKGQYVCMTGNPIIKSNTFISSRSQSEFDNLYKKYFLGEKDETNYIFSKGTTNNEELTTDIVQNRISMSLASSTCYQLIQGLIVPAGFTEQNEAILGLLHILIFFSNATQSIVYDIFKDSKLCNEETWSNIDIYYKQALKEQEDRYDKTRDIKNDYVFDRTTCIFKEYKSFDLSDTGNALRIYDTYKGRIKYETSEKRFYIYIKELGIWKKDSGENIAIKKLVNVVIDNLKTELNSSPIIQNDEELFKDFARNIKHLSSSVGKEMAIKELKAIESISCKIDDFDKDIFLLNTLDGVLNLKNGQLVKHNPNFMMTNSTRCHIDMKNEPKLWKKFMLEISNFSTEMFDYYKRCIGYSLTGSSVEQCYWGMYGDGNNGKSVWQNVMTKMLGDYAITVNINTFALEKFSSGSRATPDIARIRGKRMVLTSEPRANTILNESLIKDITGGTQMVARELYGEPFTFYPQCKIWIMCNNMLKITGTTWGDWRRVKKLDLNYIVPPEKIDRQLTDKLYEEIPQILGWALKGCLEWQETGLEEPNSVKVSVNEFRVESNSVLNFMTNFTAKANQNLKISVSELQVAYMKWARQVGENTDLSQTSFAKEVKSAVALLYPDSQRKRINGGRINYTGIQLLNINITSQVSSQDLYEEEYVIEKEK